MPVTIMISDGSSSKGLRIKGAIVDLYSLDATKVKDICLTALASEFFDAAVVSQMVRENIEEID
jgi:hypothetical protein